MKLTEMKKFLRAEDIQLSKSLGQNFLHDTNQLQRIVETAELTPTDRVLEVGPGLGPLTDLLIQNAGEVLAIEKDARLLGALRERFREALASGKLILEHADALEFISRPGQNWDEWKLVANLPYSVASPLLVDLAWGDSRPQRIVCTLQIEVAKRLMASPQQSQDYGLLTLLLQLDYAPKGWFKIPASCFFPEPDVDSACICLLRRETSLLPQEDRSAFWKIVKRGFSQRRKMMLKLLKADWPLLALQSAFASLGISPLARAETISLEQFVRLASLLSSDSKA
jgi:16S rRNA (adenine1518-N6/adenine1519-N6)-dimethyltransferase